MIECGALKEFGILVPTKRNAFCLEIKMIIGDIPDDKAIFFHYTTFAALKNILETREFWLSHISCSNDIKEGSYGIEKIFPLLKAELNNFITQEAAQEVIQNANTGVGSFCADKGDRLSQWRAYANDGYGISIGFDREWLVRKCKEQNGEYNLCQCIYGDTGNKLADLIQKVRKAITSTGHTSKYTPEQISFVLLVIAAHLSKHNGFEEEDEVRIFANAPASMCYRENKNGRIIPYHPMLLGSDFSWLKKIIIGPCEQQVAIAKAVEIILEQNKITDIRPVLSSIPYRGIRNY